MNTMDYKTKYKDNIEVLKKLNNMYNRTSDKNQKLLVKSAIDKVEEEQKEISTKLRKDMYNSISKKNFSLLMNKEKNDKLVIDDNNSIVVEKENVVISNVSKLDDHIKVINITGEEDNKDDDITEVLKREKIDPSKLEDAKVIFDGAFKLIYDNGRGLFEQNVNDIILEYDIESDDESLNSSIVKLLKSFDEQNGTEMYQRYQSNELSVIYDFTKIKNNKNKKQIKTVRKIAKKESKKYDNVTIKDNRIKKFKTGLAAIATAGVILFGGIFSYNMNSKRTTNASETTIEHGVTDAEIEATTESVEVTTEAVVKKEVTNENKVVKEKKETNITQKKEEPVVEEEEDNLKIGDSVDFNQTDLYYASTDNSPRGNTKYIVGNYHYKASIISVVYKNQVMDLVYDDSIDIDALDKICREKYGDDVKISVNFDLVDENDNIVTEHVGWVNASDIVSKGKVLRR